MRYIMVDKPTVQFINNEGKQETALLYDTRLMVGKHKFIYESNPVITSKGETIFHLPKLWGLVPRQQVEESVRQEKNTSAQLLGFEIIINNGVPDGKLLFVHKQGEQVSLEGNKITMEKICKEIGIIINIGE